MISHRAFACSVLLLCGGCPTVDLGDDPPAVGLCNPTGGYDYFQNMVVPQYLKLTKKVARREFANLATATNPTDNNVPASRVKGIPDQ